MNQIRFSTGPRYPSLVTLINAMIKVWLGSGTKEYCLDLGKDHSLQWRK